MNRKAKVLHVIWSGGIGGTEEYITSLIKHIDPDKFHSYICFLSKKGVIYEEVAGGNSNITCIGMRSGYDVIGSVKFLIYLYKEKFNIIHSHSSNVLAGLIIALCRKPKKVFTEHISPGAGALFEKRKLFYRLFSGSFQIITAISGYVKQELIEGMKINPEKIEVVYNGIREDKFHSADVPSGEAASLKKDGNKMTFGFIGRMADFKRPGLFVEIAGELAKEEGYRFVMVGDGPELGECRETIWRRGIESRFELLGFRRDIPDILRTFDALIFTSIGEGFGIVLIEAMAMGIPVLAVNDGAVPEIIKHRKNGILLDGDDPVDIARQIIEAVNNEELMRRIQYQCTKDAFSMFSIEKSAAQMENIYMKLLTIDG